jgi:hypothetical protein
MDFSEHGNEISGPLSATDGLTASGERLVPFGSWCQGKQLQ